MCLNGNKALLSCEYIKSQLHARWVNAQTCADSEHSEAKTHVEFRSAYHDESYYAESRYTRALAEFQFAGKNPPNSIAKDALAFDATFDEPKLEFICNHEAAMTINIKYARFNSNNASSDSLRQDKADYQEIKDGLAITFRVKFERRPYELDTKATAVGFPISRVQLLILEVLDAQPILYEPALVGSQKALDYYLKEYLVFLRTAGHHVLFDLPNFGEYKLEQLPYVNYSVIRKKTEFERLTSNVSVHGVDVPTINEYLRKEWLAAACALKGIFGQQQREELAGSIAEFSNTYAIDNDTSVRHVKFHPLRIQALCPCEVVLYFTAAEVGFLPSEGIEEGRSFKNWVFAFIVEVVEVRGEGNLAHLEFDFRTARYCEYLSRHVLIEQNQADVQYVDEMVRFLSGIYLQILDYYHRVLYRSNSGNLFTGAGFLGNESDRVKEGATQFDWNELVRETRLFGYDHIVSLSEQSLSARFSYLYSNKAAQSSHEILLKWCKGNDFNATFDPLRVKLLSEGFALVTFTISTGSMSNLDGYTERMHTFEKWLISYLIPVKGRLSSEGPNVLEQWPESHISKAHGKGTYSLMPGLWDEDDFSFTIAILANIATHMKLYMENLVAEGYHIVHSTPIHPTAEKTTNSLTSVTFQIVSDGLFGGRKYSSGKIPWQPAWALFGQAKAFGTLYLSKAALMEKMLSEIAHVNSQTTIMSRYPTATEEELGVYITTWAENPLRNFRQCKWKRTKNTELLEYGWHHRDDLSHEHEWTDEVVGGVSAQCTTTNRLTIPTSQPTQQLEILAHGESTIKLTSKEHSSWSCCVVKWAAPITIVTDQCGLVINSEAQKVTPSFGDVESQGEWSNDAFNPKKLLQEQFPEIVDLDGIFDHLEEFLTRNWTFSYAGMQAYSLGSPLFTQNEDFIAQLRPFNAEAIPTTTKSIRAPFAVRPKLDLPPNWRTGAVNSGSPRFPLRPLSALTPAPLRGLSPTLSSPGSIGSPSIRSLSPPYFDPTRVAMTSISGAFEKPGAVSAVA
ncbi:hypothetical protein ONZ45_g17545 [Pleurotus djamor]|nr:hypothetical protein ONZ45_g17545 [Pleurotus djamor]